MHGFWTDILIGRNDEDEVTGSEIFALDRAANYYYWQSAGRCLNGLLI